MNKLRNTEEEIIRTTGEGGEAARTGVVLVVLVLRCQ